MGKISAGVKYTACGVGAIVTVVPGTTDWGTRNDILDAILHCRNKKRSRVPVPGTWNARSFLFPGDEGRGNIVVLVIVRFPCPRRRERLISYFDNMFMHY
jgi:hypothetical protein